MKALMVLSLVLSSFLGASSRASVHLQWEAALDDCGPADLVISSDGQSYIACQKSFGTAVHVYSYNAQGKLLVQHILAAEGQENLVPRDLLLHQGQLYLSLIRTGSEGAHSRLIAFDPLQLKILWQQDRAHFNGNQVISNADGGVWQLGLTDARAADFAAYRFTQDGEEKSYFLRETPDEDSLGFDRRSGASAPDSGLYIGGFSQLMRVDAEGQLLWTQNFPTTAIASRPNGDLYATNLLLPSGNSARVSPEGKILWQIPQGGSAIALHDSGSIWIAGTKVTDSASEWDLRVLSLTSEGQLIFLDSYDGRYQDRAVDVAVDAAGNGYVLASSFVKSGWFGTADRYLVMKYSPKGQRLWTQIYGRTGLPEALAVTPDGRIFAVGRDGTIGLQ